MTVNLRNIKRKKKSAYGRHPEVKSKINNFLVEMKKKTDLNLEKFKSKNPSSMKHQKNNEIKKSLSQNSQINKSIFSEILLNNKNNENDMFNQSFGCNENSNNIIVNLEEKQENTSYKSERSHISKSLGKETGGISNDSNSNSDEYQIDQIITNIRKL